MLRGERFLRPVLNLPIVVGCKMDENRVTVRTFYRHPDMQPPGEVIPVEQAQPLLAGHSEPFIETRATPKFSWFLSTALTGAWVDGDRSGPFYLQEVGAFSFVLDVDVLGSGAMSELANWMFPCEPNGRLLSTYNRVLDTFDSKQHRTKLYFDRQESSVLTISMPFVEPTFARANVFLKYNAAYGVCHNLPNPRLIAAPPMGYSNDYETVFGGHLRPGMRIAGSDFIAPGGYETFTVDVFHPEDEQRITDVAPRFHIESSGGYVVHRVVQGAAGVGTFKIGALGMNPGETIKIKAGFRYYSGMAEKTITVV